MNIVNMTPHAVAIVDGPTFAPSGTIARVDIVRTEHVAATREIGVPCHRSTAGFVTGLPPATPGTVYIVSGMVRSALPGRWDLLSPGDLVRDDTGRVIGCRGFDVN